MPASKAVLETRSKILEAVRSFFSSNGFIEVETPVRIPVPALELHIDAEPSGEQYLRTSPELHMKRLLAAGHERIFQVGPCFRRGEKGRLHNPEYTMLEWYRAPAGYIDVLADAKRLLAHVVKAVKGKTSFRYQGVTVEVMPVWECRPVSDLFIEFAGWDPTRKWNADMFDMDLVGKIEPAIPRDKPFVMKDYPVQAAALARVRAGNPPVAERWELYVAGIELANAFSELTDPVEQRERLEECGKERTWLGKDAYGLDEDFLGALERGMPACGGVALGIDRLVMLMTDSPHIEDVRAF